MATHTEADGKSVSTGLSDCFSKASAITKEAVPCGTCVLDLGSSKLFDAAGQEIFITPFEFNLLRVLSEYRGHPLTNDDLIELAHAEDWTPYERSVELRINRLRRKIEPDPKMPEVIRTVDGTSFLLEAVQ